MLDSKHHGSGAMSRELRAEIAREIVEARELSALAKLMTEVLDCGAAQVSFLDEEGGRRRLGFNLPEDVSFDAPFFERAARRKTVFIVCDARDDQRSARLKTGVSREEHRFYAGKSVSVQGWSTPCVVSIHGRRPRKLSREQTKKFAKFAAAFGDMIEAIVDRTVVEQRGRMELRSVQEPSSATSILEQITKMSGVGGWELQLDPMSLTWTKETKRIHEVPMDFEPVLDEAINFYAPEARAIISEAVETAIATGVGWDLELPMVTARGKRIQVHAVGSAIVQDGRTKSLIGAFQDVSAWRDAEAQIRASEEAARQVSEELRTILENMGEGVSVFDEDAMLVTWNQRYIDLFEKPHGETCVGASFRELLMSKKARGIMTWDVDAALKKIRLMQVTREPISLRYRTAAGRIITSTHAPLPKGGWVGTHADITAQVVVSERAQTIIRSVVDGIITIDDRGRILEFNPASEKMFGYSAAEVAGKNVAILMGARDAARHDEYLVSYKKSPGSKIVGRERELVGVRKNGDTFPLELSVSTTSDQNGRIFTGILRDITARKQIETMKDQFVSTVNHELRTPLTAIRGSLGLMKATAVDHLDEKSRRLLELSVNGCDRLSSLVNDMLDMERIASGKMDYLFVVTEINDLVKDVVERHQSYADLHEVTFAVAAAEEEIYCNVDLSRFNQALVNLLSNAAKFSAAGGTVIFKVEKRSGGRVRILVRDNGAGIPPEFSRRVFEKFARADNSLTRGKGGTGLGLSITRDIVHAFGGSIDFESQLSVGTTFWIDLPVADRPPPLNLERTLDQRTEPNPLRRRRRSDRRSRHNDA